MATLREQVGQLVRHHRKMRGLTQADLAEQTKRSVEMIARIERGAAAPSFETLEAFSNVLEVPTRDFFGVGDHSAQAGSNDALARLIGRVSVLDGEDIEWVDRLVAMALNRKVRPTKK